MVKNLTVNRNEPEDNWSVCRIVVNTIKSLYQEVQPTHAIHPKGQLEAKYRGAKECALIDLCGVLIVFPELIS